MLRVSALLDFLEFAFATLSRSCGFIRTAVSMCYYFFILEKHRDSNKSNNLPPHWKAVFFCREHLHILKHVNKIGLVYWRPKQKVLVRWHQSWNLLDLCFARLNLFLMHLFYLFPCIRCFCFVLLKVFFIKSFFVLLHFIAKCPGLINWLCTCSKWTRMSTKTRWVCFLWFPLVV